MNMGVAGKRINFCPDYTGKEKKKIKKINKKHGMN